MYERRQGFSRHDEPTSGRRVEARVKWFNGAKGFGFVTPNDGGQDAFLPIAVLRRAGYEEVGEGASVLCEIGESGKGPLVLNVMSVDDSTVVARPRRPAGGGGGGADRGSDAPRVSHGSVEGAVKWFEATKGFGFISPDQGGKDIFIHVTALRRSGLETLEAGARVRVDVVDGRKGLEADRVTLI